MLKRFSNFCDKNRTLLSNVIIGFETNHAFALLVGDPRTIE